MNAMKLGNQRRFILKTSKLSLLELDDIHENVRNFVRSENDRHENSVIEKWPPDNMILSIEKPVVKNNILNDYEVINPLIETDSVGPIDQSIMEMEIQLKTKWEEVKLIDINQRDALPRIRMNSNTRKICNLLNKAIESITNKNTMLLTDINHMIYAAALLVLEKLNIKIKKPTIHTKQIPKWKIRIQNKIMRWRKNLALIQEFKHEPCLMSKKKCDELIKMYRIRNEADIQYVEEKLKQQIQAKAQRIRRYEKRCKQFKQNKLFQEDKKKFFRELNKKQFYVKEPPNQEELNTFWKSIWEVVPNQNTNAKWIKRQIEKYYNYPQMNWNKIETVEVTTTLKKSANWKAPGKDRIQNFWLKSFSSLHKNLAMAYNEIIEKPHTMPQWLTEGITYLIPKSEETKNPKNYRPITCLSTIYKHITSIITERIYKFLDENSILPVEQKGCHKGSFGCQDQLIINNTIMEHCKKKRKNISVAWIDYKKAFDSVPHEWIKNVMNIYNINPTLTYFLSTSMRNWKTQMLLFHSKGVMVSESVQIRRGIFQGDSLSPLLFCMTLIPLSQELRDNGFGYELEKNMPKIGHLLYMDDLKLYAKNDIELEKQIRIVNSFSEDICMEFGLDKCAKASFKAGKLAQTSNIILNMDIIIKDLKPNEVYKYLGVEESDGVQQSKMKEKISREYYKRTRMILKSELNAKNKITGINLYSIPVIRYGFGIIDWKLEEIKKIDRKTRKLLTIHGIHHPRADIDRLYVHRENGGRGLLQLEASFKTAVIGLAYYLEKTEEYILDLVKRSKTKNIDGIFKNADKFLMHLNIDRPMENDRTANQGASQLKLLVKKGIEMELINKWENKPLHGQYLKTVKDETVERKHTHAWLRYGKLKGETEGLIVAAQDQALNTRNYQRNVMKLHNDGLCRLCKERPETIEHIVSACPILAKSDYIQRHDKVCSLLHWNICKYYDLPYALKWYNHKPQTVTSDNMVTIIWNEQIQTDRTIKANKPDIIIRDKNNNLCLIIDVAIPSNLNITQKEAEKRNKYKDLQIEIQRMWGINTKIVPIIIGACGVIPKNFESNLSDIPGSHCILELQKTALLGTASILRKVL